MSKSVEVPHLGGNLQVRAILPKFQRAVHAKATKDGKIDLQEKMVWKLVYGLMEPRLTEAEARQLTHQFTVGALQPIIDEIDRLSGTDEHLASRDQPYSVRKITEPMTMATAWLQRFPEVVTGMARSRGSHRPQPGRRRGSRRGARATSSSSDDPEPEPPGGARTCTWCGESISHKNADARHCSDRCRVYANRARDKADPDRVAARAVENGVGRLAASCRCSPRRNPLEPGWCHQCGRPRGSVTVAWVPAGPRSKQLVMRDLARRKWRTSDGKRHPKREFVDETIVAGVAS
jgi:hypothetical protein